MAKTEAYLEMYEVLSNAASTLENMEVPDVDEVMPLVTKGIGALKVCQERIQQVRLQLSEIQI